MQGNSHGKFYNLSFEGTFWVVAQISKALARKYPVILELETGKGPEFAFVLDVPLYRVEVQAYFFTEYFQDC